MARDRQSPQRYAAGVALVFAGMLGLWFHVEYSGWVLVFGILVVL